MDINNLQMADKLTFLQMQEQVEILNTMGVVPYFGIWELTIKEAAELLTVDLWFAGEIKAEVPEAESYDPKDPMLRRALAEQCKKTETLLLSAVSNGTMKTSLLRRKFLSEVIDTEETYVHFPNLCSWLGEFNYKPGEAFNDYYLTEAAIFKTAWFEVKALRSLDKKILQDGDTWFQPVMADNTVDKAEVDKIRRKIKLLSLENMALHDTLEFREVERSKKTNLPLATRTRKTLLVIIAALCEQLNINYTERGAAQQVKRHTEEFGIPIDEKTIMLFLNEINSAVEDRTKDQ